MPRKRATGEHTYSVFVDSVLEDGTLMTEQAYQGSSKYTAQMKLAQAIMDHPNAYRIDLRCDFALLVRVYVERPRAG